MKALSFSRGFHINNIFICSKNWPPIFLHNFLLSGYAVHLCSIASCLTTLHLFDLIGFIFFVLWSNGLLCSASLFYIPQLKCPHLLVLSLRFIKNKNIYPLVGRWYLPLQGKPTKANNINYFAVLWFWMQPTAWVHGKSTTSYVAVWIKIIVLYFHNLQYYFFFNKK